MQVDTGAFTVLRDQVAALETEVAGLREAVVFTDALGDCIYERGYQHGRESILGASAMPLLARRRRDRPAGHLRAVGERRLS